MNARSSTPVPLPEIPSAESTYRTVGGVDLHVVAAGDSDDPLVIMLHGFPEFWYEWREYVEPFVSAGYRVLVPDQRGYNLSDKPDGVGSYRISTLSRDIAELIATEGRESAHVVGHDWGAGVAWDLALRQPEVVNRLGIVNVPHPMVMRDELTSNPAQLAKSWYMLFFQLPRFPEFVCRADDYYFMLAALSEARTGAFTPADLDQYRKAWGREGALTAMINWYRAMFRYREMPPLERVQPPTLVLWGDEDSFLAPELANQSVAYCEDGRLERFPDATHWIVHERTERLTELLLEHLDG